MNKVRRVAVYNLVDSNRNHLRLELGVIDDPDDRIVSSRGSSRDMGYRWCFVGTKIPMPVRSMCWFNGFPESTMLDWLKGNGWFVRSKVYVPCGYTTIYELPKGDEDPEEIFVRQPIDKKSFDDAICFLYNNGKRITAIRAYRYAYGGDLDSAAKAVREIVDEQH